MLDPAFVQFLNDLKTAWLDKALKSVKTDEAKAELTAQAAEQFLLTNWLSPRAKSAGQLAITSHPPKFTHTAIKKEQASAVIANCKPANDGFLRSGNVQGELDVFGNAAALPIYKFLNLVLADQQSVLSHLEQDSAFIRDQFTQEHVDYDAVRQDLLAIKQTQDNVKTHTQLKQVYFPIDDDVYHLLTPLTPSGIIFKLKEHINDMRFSDTAKEAREHKKKQQLHEQGYDDVYDLTIIGYGGTKPQNVSVLNTQNGGTAYLLPSLPPVLEKYKIPKPRESFFDEILWIKSYQAEFHHLHKEFIIEADNKDTKIDRDEIITSIFKKTLEKLWEIRSLDAHWSTDRPLPESQKIWLDNGRLKDREQDQDWLEEIINSYARWFIRAYIKIIGKKQAIILGDSEYIHLFKRIVRENQEDLL